VLLSRNEGMEDGIKVGAQTKVIAKGVAGASSEELKGALIASKNGDFVRDRTEILQDSHDP
jgi:hypothetical protein